MRQLFPRAADHVDPAVAYADLPVVPGRPAVRLNVVASLDGAATLDGRSGGLAGSADRRVFRTLRTLADVVLVGAGTVRAEGYRGLPLPLAIVSRSCDFGPDDTVFTGNTRPILITVASAPAARVAALRDVAEVVIAGAESVDFRAALGVLGEMGFQHVLAESGPRVNAQLAATEVLDELCLTVAPCLVGDDAPRILNGPAVGPVSFAPHMVCEEDGFLFLRMRPS